MSVRKKESFHTEGYIRTFRLIINLIGWGNRYGWRGHSSPSVNNVTQETANRKIIEKSGKYRGSACENAPIGGSTWFFYEIDVWNSNYIRITAKRVGGTESYTNIKDNGIWLGWKHDGLKSFNIGDIKITTNNTNPQTYMIGSTWESIDRGIDGLYFWKRLS